MFTQLSVFTNIGFAIWQAIRSLIGVIAGALYGYIVDLYNVFMIIARADILDDKYVQLIYNRVGMLLGLFMLFKLSFTLIQSIVNPDKISDKKSGFANVIIRCIVAIVLLGVTPSLFKMAREFQNVIVGSKDDSNNVLYRILVADDVVNGTTAGFGQKLSSDLFFSFFREKNGIHYMGDVRIEDNDGNRAFIYEDYDQIKEDVENGNKSFSELVPYLSLRDNGNYVFHWDIILSVGAAIAVLWILVNYCISVAVRVIQLAYLQLVAPIPILSYIGDPDGAFKKWTKQCSSTYLDLFMRLAIIYFIVTISNKALDIINSVEFLNRTGLDKDTDKFVLVKVFLLIGLLMFGKKVPELLKELFPGDGKFDLGIKTPKKLLGEIPGGKAAWGLGKGATIGAGLGVVGAGVSSISRYKSNKANGKSVGKSMLGGIYGVGSGLFKGTKSGLTKKGLSGGWKNIQEANNKYNKLITSGGTTMGTIRAKVGDTFGESKGQEFTRLMANYQKVIDDNKYINDVAEEFSEVKKLKTRWETLRMSGASETAIDSAFKTYKNAKKSALNAAINGNSEFGYFKINDDGVVASGPTIGSLESFEDAAFSGQIEARANATKDFVNSHNVKLKYKDDVTGEIRDLTADELTHADMFKKASVSASNSQTEILSNNDFGAAIANDAAAGVDSNRTARKDK